MATWEEAIESVLREADGALHYTDIAERILLKGLRDNPGATPAQTVASTLSISIRNDPDSPFQRVSRGEYILREGGETARRDSACRCTRCDRG